MNWTESLLTRLSCNRADVYEPASRLKLKEDNLCTKFDSFHSKLFRVRIFKGASFLSSMEHFITRRTPLFLLAFASSGNEKNEINLMHQIHRLLTVAMS